MTLIRHTRYFWVLTLLLGLWQTSAMAEPPSFSSDQASAGRKAYREHCASCHGSELEGIMLAPSLRGGRFDQTWRGKSAAILSFHLHRMPPEPIATPGSLGEETYTNILAYLLKSNGLDSGDVALPSDMDALGNLTIPWPEGMQADPDAPVAGPDQTERLENLSDVTNEMLRNPSPNDWMQWGRTYDGHGFSPLKQINKENVAELKLAWRTPLRNGTSMPTPLVHDGVMFLNTYPDTVLAINAANGKVLWRHQYDVSRQSSQKMGLALHGDKVLVPTSDLHVVALHAKTGELIWDHEITPETPAAVRGRYQLRSAPLVVGDKVVQGVTASGAPKGGFIVAIGLASGEEVWRFNTIARPDEPYGNSWNGLPLEGRSGGSVWHQGTYDAASNLIYFGVAPTYDTGPLLHPVDNDAVNSDALYTNCTLALDADTGKLVWHYQHMVNDQWDLDWAFERQIVEMQVDGAARKVVLNVGKMAILEALDAATGEYLFSMDTGVQNVITAIDPETGIKTVDPDKWPSIERPCVICPSAIGARSWPPTSYSPKTKLVYLPLSEWCMGMGPTGFKLLTSGVGLTSEAHPDTDDGMMGRLQAIDLQNQKTAWTHHQTTPLTTSVLSTAGGLVFSGDIVPSLKALDDATGELLWQATLDDSPSSSVVTYNVDNTQYVAVIVGFTNNHIRDLTRSYGEFHASMDKPAIESPKGGAAIWVFSL